MRGNVPPRRLRRTGLERPTPTGPAAWSLEAGKRGRKSRVRPTGTRACPRPGPPRSPGASPQGPAPVPTAGPGLRRVASGNTVPREHAHGPGSTSPAARAGGVRSRLPIGTWVKIPAEGRPTTGPREGPRTGPRAPGRAIPRGPGVGGHPPERDAGDRKNKVRSARKGRRQAGPAAGWAGRAGGPAHGRVPPSQRSSPASAFGCPRAAGHRRAPVDTTGQPGGRAAVTPSETCTSNLRRTGDAPSPRHHRDDSAGDAGRPQRLPGHSGQIPPLGAVAGAPEGTDDIKAAARWRPTTGANISGTDPDREPARAPRRRPGRRTSSRPTSDVLSGPGAGRLRPPSSRPPRRDPGRARGTRGG